MLIFLKILLVYTWVFVLAIFLYKLHFCPLNIIIDSFKSNVIATNFSITFLQIVEITNFIG